MNVKNETRPLKLESKRVLEYTSSRFNSCGIIIRQKKEKNRFKIYSDFNEFYPFKCTGTSEMYLNEIVTLLL